VLITFFSELKKVGAEFGFRTASEILRFVAVINKIEPHYSLSEIMDAAIMQKLLPKVHGSRRKLEPVLKTLGTLCLQNGKQFDDYAKSDFNIDYSSRNDIKYPISLEKITRMYQNILNNSFTSYAEA
jgi:5-methylcytosine-specific restriction protein B